MYKFVRKIAKKYKRNLNLSINYLFYKLLTTR